MIRDLRVKKAPDSGSATLLNRSSLVSLNKFCTRTYTNCATIEGRSCTIEVATGNLRLFSYVFVCWLNKWAWRYQDQKDKQDQSVEGGVKLHKGRPGTKAGYHTLTTGCRPPPPLPWGKAGRNHLNEKVTPLLPSGIGERFSQTISNLGHASLLRRCELPPINESAEVSRGASR